VLPVGIDLHRERVGIGTSETEPGPKRRSDAQIEWVSSHDRPGFMGKFRRSIRRTVIHDENVNVERTS